MKKIYYIIGIILLFSFTFSGDLQAQAESQDIRNNAISAPSLNLYPQPASNLLYIEFPGNQVSQPHVDMYDMIGNLQDKITLERVNPGTFMINLSGKRAGFYFLRIRTDEGSWSRRITVRP